MATATLSAPAAKRQRTKFTPELVDRIRALHQQGVPAKEMCATLGIKGPIYRIHRKLKLKPHPPLKRLKPPPAKPVQKILVIKIDASMREEAEARDVSVARYFRELHETVRAERRSRVFCQREKLEPSQKNGVSI